MTMKDKPRDYAR